jgi:ABC-type transporter Mla maintaining outer membrane lipid asymmetry ATPase subunit MlaF
MEEFELETNNMVPSPQHELIFEDITVSMGEKVILNNVCGMAQSGKPLAIMGPSGEYKIHVTALVVSDLLTMDSTLHIFFFK